MKKEFLLAILILTGFTSFGQSRPHGVMSESELRYFRVHKPKLPEWDTLQEYFCTDWCMMCGCIPHNDSYEKDSTVYCFSEKELQDDGVRKFWLIFKFDRLTKEITVFDRIVGRNVQVQECRRQIRKYLNKVRIPE